MLSEAREFEWVGGATWSAVTRKYLLFALSACSTGAESSFVQVSASNARHPVVVVVVAQINRAEVLYTDLEDSRHPNYPGLYPNTKTCVWNLTAIT